jgi:hypothetical protein
MFTAAVRSLRCAILSRLTKTRNPNRRRPLAFEVLEAREVPASFYWLGRGRSPTTR